MNKLLDNLDKEIAEGAVSPISGLGSAIGAGEALAPSQMRRVTVELPAYMFVQIAWFAAFGLQTVLFPYLLKNVLQVSGSLLGLAQMALAAPSVIFILLGGVLAERADGRRLLILFHLLAALPAIFLAVTLRSGAQEYWMMLVYAVAMGTIGAFMMPARDAILNEVVDRRRRCGSRITIQQGVAFATLAQFAAQIVGLWIGGSASSWGVWPLLFAQSAIVGAGAIAAFFLARGRVIASSDRESILREIAAGMRAVRRNPVLLTMVVSMFGVGVFVIGAFLVILPIVNADVYNHRSGGLRNIFVTFWAGAFVSSVLISQFRNIRRPGRLLLIAQFIGSAGILIMMTHPPYATFLWLVFLWGLAAGVSIMMSRTIVQEAAPPDLLARVLSIYQLGFMSGAPVGAGLMGVISDQAGPSFVMLVPAVGMLAMIVVMAFFTPIWNMRGHVRDV